MIILQLLCVPEIKLGRCLLPNIYWVQNQFVSFLDSNILFFLFYLFIYFFYFTLLYWFLQYINLNPPWVYVCSPSWTPLPPFSLSHPSGSSQCTSPEHPVSCIEPGLATCFTHTWQYTYFNAILSNHPTLTFSHRVQKTVLYICVSFAVSHIACPAF